MRLSSGEVHYLRHVRARLDWPATTSLEGYVESIRGVVMDPTGAIFAGRFRGTWQVTFLREARDLQGPDGQRWVRESAVARDVWYIEWRDLMARYATLDGEFRANGMTAAQQQRHLDLSRALQQHLPTLKSLQLLRPPIALEDPAA